MDSHCASISSTSRILDGSQQQQTLLAQSCHSFCHDYLMPKLKDITSRSYSEQYSNTAHVEITEIDRKIGTKLAVTPLTENRDRYLCIFFQLPPEMPTDQHQQIISKIRNAI